MGAHRLAGRCRVAGLGPVLVAAALVLASVVLALPARAATFAATASVDVHTQFVGDTAKDFTFTVTNTGTTDNVAAVLISKPNTRWAITACPQGPAGWTATTAVTVSDTKCRYTSAAGPADDIVPAGSSSAFVVRANSVPGATDATGNWVVFVSKNGSFGSADIAGATPAAAGGLGTTAHVWEITDAVVGSAAATPGTACPPSEKQAETGSTTAVVVCGKNHANAALTPAAANSTLGGTFVQTSGTFGSGPVAASSPSPVVLGSWTGTTVTGSAGAGKTVVATLGSSAMATSPSTTLTGYTAVQPNAAPVLANIETISLVYNENGPPVAVTGTITVADADNANLASATVTISFGYLNGSDVLALPSPPAGITPSFDVATGTLTLTGSASVADYQAALRGVTYVNTSDHPFSAPRTVSFQVNDGAAASNTVSRDIAVSETNDAPVLANIEAGALTFTEGGAAQAVTSTITVADPDSNLASATVVISAGYQNGEDVLALPSPPAGITPSFSAGTGTLTLSGAASPAAYQAALRGVTYQNTSNTADTGTRTLTFQAKDTTTLDSNTVTRDITVAAVNSAPVLADIEGPALAFAEGDAAKVITAAITVADADNANLAGATVTVTTGYVNGQDVLALASPPAGITPSFDPGTGTLTLTGSSSLANYETALRGVTFANSSDDPTPGTRTVSFQVNDGAAANNLSNVAARDVAVAPVDDAPVLAGIEGTPLGYTAGDPPTVITSSVTVADADSANLTSATVAITAGYQNGQDVLALPTPPGGITPSFDAGSGTLTLTGSASVADYQAALRAVTYQNTSGTPNTGTRTVSFTVDDGAAATASNTVTRDITLASVNSAPVLANIEGAALAFSEGDAAKAITSTITVADADSPNLASATVIISAGYEDGQDVLALPSPPAGITPAFNAVSGTLTLTGSASVATYETALRGVTFANGSNTPSTTTRTISFQVNDGAAANNLSNVATRNITFAGVNDAPVLAGIEGTALTFSEGDAAKAITSTITVADADSPNLASATVIISAGFQSGQDVLALPSPPAGITPSFDAASGTMTLTGSASPADYQAALRAVTFANPSETPSTAARTVSFRVDDGAAANNLSNIVTRNITVSSVNDAPVLANVEAGALTYTENDAATPITSTITVTDADGTTLTGATVSISTGFANGQDVLSFTNQLGITGSYSAGTGVLTLSGTASVSDYQTALRDVKYNNTSDDPSTAARTISFQVNDGAAASNLSNVATRSVTVVAVNDAPVLAGVEGTALSYTENDPATSVTGSLTVTDNDTPNLTGATVSITNNLVTPEDVLSFTNQLGITGSYNAATGVMTLSGTTTVANYQTALRAVKYSNSSQNPSSAARTVSFQVNDGAAANNLSNTVTRNITVLPVNDNPTVVNEAFTGAIGNTKFAVGVSGEAGPVVEVSGNVLSNDSDVDGPGPLTTSLAAPNPPGGRVVTMNSNGTFVYVPAPGFTGNDTFQYTVSDSGGGTSNGTVTVTVQNAVVWYVNDALPTNGDGRSTTPFNTLAPLQGAGDVDAPGHTIFLYGSGTYTGGLVLEANQRLIGSPEGLVNIGTPPVTLIAANPGGTNPTITNSAGVGITLANDTTIRRVNVANTSSAGINGSAITNADIGPNMTISNASGAGFAVFGSASGTITMAASITHSSGTGRSVGVGGRTGGTVTISGAVNDTGGGVQVTNNANATVNFTGGLSINLSNVNDAFSATGGGTVNVTGTNTLSAAAPALTVNGASIGASGLTFQSINSNGGSYGILLTGTGAGSFTVTGTGPAGSGGTIQNKTGDAISLTNVGGVVSLTNMATSNVTGTDVLVDGGAAAFTYTGTITNQSGKNRSVAVSNRTGGTVLFSGVINDDGTGINLSSNTGAAINFTGGLTLSTGASPAFTATGGGTVNVTGTNTITTTTGTALTVTNTNIGASGLTFRSITAGTPASGPVNGIVLDNTGTSAGLTVSGTGSAGTGGTIQRTSGAGISLLNTRSPSFAWMNIQNTTGSGINGSLVTNFSLTNSTINNSGAVAAADTSNVAFNSNPAPIGSRRNLSGTVTITGNTLTNAAYHGVDIFNWDGTISSATISNNTITSSMSTATSKGGGIRFVAFGSAGTAATITQATLDNNQITNFPSGVGLQVQCGNGNSTTAPIAGCGTPGSGTNIVNITNNTIQGASAANRIGAEGLIALATGRGQGNFNISGNTIRHTVGISLSHSSFGRSTVTSTISNNTIVSNNGFGAQGIGVGTSSSFGSSDTPSLTTTISGNSISQTDGTGILVVARDATATVRAKIQNNSVAAPLAGARQGIRVDSGNAQSVNETVCVNISGNTSAGSNAAARGIGLRKEGTVNNVNTFGVHGMAATASPGVETYVNGLNPAGGGTLLISASSGFTNCSLP